MNTDKGLSVDQAHRILESFQTVVLSMKLCMQVLDSLGKDISGMLNGNGKEIPTGCNKERG